MLVQVALALAACAGRIAAASARATAALEAIAQRMAQSMVDALVHGTGALALARGWLRDPAWREAVTALSGAVADAVVAPALLAALLALACVAVFDVSPMHASPRLSALGLRVVDARAALLALAWFAGFEASPLQATPGKRALGLRVVDARGARLALGRAALRHLAGTLSWLSLNLGHLLAALPPRHQALHDRLAGTRVLQRAGARLPAWSLAWLGLQLLAAVAAGACLLAATQQAIERAFDAL